MSTLVLDIGTYSIKAIAGKAGPKPKIERIAEVFNTTGIAVPTDDVNQDKLINLIESVIVDNDLPRTDVRLSLPESVISSKVIEIPPLSDAELASAIGWQAEQHIPIPPEELALEYQVLYRPPKSEKRPMRIMLIGARKQVVDRYVDMFHALGIEPSLVETHMLSLVRSLMFTAEDPNTMVVHIGASSMNMAVVRQGEIAFVTSHMNGGQLLTKALEKSVGLDQDQAEKYKRTYGLDETQFQGKVAQAILPGIQVLSNEIKKSVQFFGTQFPNESVQRVVLSGGTASMPNLVQFIAQELGTEVLVAAPFTGVEGTVPETINPPAMGVCMGLLLREL
ncbi:MAG: type IV pilus assembly protein PilM [Pseudomonadales bacterium]|nr:type IV pilus assembly protein PilM [Candidatus Woesebacteria bacterium]MCB9801166.1 type IV pilus assembly protein PilM [Pseudomonadales bacterium]